MANNIEVPTNVILLLRANEFGSTLNRCKFAKKYSKYHDRSHSDFKILRSLYCSSGAYLETIACRKVEAAKTPAFYHGRLFTQNFQTWFNLFTGPTSGPSLMNSNILSSFKLENETIKIVDAVCIQPPYSCTPPSDGSSRGAQVILLSKSGCLFQVDARNGDVLDSFSIPSKYSMNNVISDDSEAPSQQFQPIHSYHYANTNRDSESIVIKSARKVVQGVSSTSFLILRLYPIRIYCHFLINVKTHSTNPPITAEVTDDFLVVAATKASKISFYSLDEIVNEHKYKIHCKLKEQIKVVCPNGYREYVEGNIGNKNIGIPYTMHCVQLSNKEPMFDKCSCLFKTAAPKHSIQFGGKPYHYIVAGNKRGTAWSLKHLSNCVDATKDKIQVSEKWDSTHWNSVRFHDDDTGRIIIQDVSSLEILSIHHPTDVDQSNNHGGTCASKGSSDVSKCSLVSNFRICVDSKLETPDTIQTQWQYPFSHDMQREALPPHTITTHGRASRRPRPWYDSLYHRSQRVDDNEGHLLAHVEYDADINMLGLLYFKPIGPAAPGWELQEDGANLHLSLYDNFNGKCLASFLIDWDISPSDRDVVSITIDQDTVIYMRLRANDHRVQYRVLRLNRQPGSDVVVVEDEST
uniref:DDB1- and CUL4-associated factor 17-like isoform X2 n=1 Tax=Ciona intestinalis TaxID=7719 RepID=UPI000EF4BF32|nr:DDB1- and CUL4-associated factor 17-like isoform X2 [Ciona intestinalis]|eukprot:XP_026694494.1 DDB1- and CUL4-associated factor 17-like isoform X2 [Ciona intestinalis]